MLNHREVVFMRTMTQDLITLSKYYSNLMNVIDLDQDLSFKPLMLKYI
jgi:hypothetical protein